MNPVVQEYSIRKRLRKLVVLYHPLCPACRLVKRLVKTQKLHRLYEYPIEFINVETRLGKEFAKLVGINFVPAVLTFEDRGWGLYEICVHKFKINEGVLDLETVTCVEKEVT